MRTALFEGDWPISQAFGANPQLYYDTFGLAGHNGVDFALPPNTPIYAAEDGVITSSYDPSGYGVTIYLDSTTGNGWRYGHLSYDRPPQAATDPRVTAGQLIGYSNNTGYSTGPHLHAGLRPPNTDYDNGYSGYIDPLPTLDTLPPAPTPTELASMQALIDQLTALINNLSAELDLQATINNLNGVIQTLNEQLAYKDELLQQANSRAGVAEQQRDELSKQLEDCRRERSASEPPAQPTQSLT